MLLRGLVSTHLLAINGNLDDGEELNDTINPQGKLAEDEVEEVANGVDILVQCQDLGNKTVHAECWKDHKSIETHLPDIAEPKPLKTVFATTNAKGLAFIRSKYKRRCSISDNLHYKTEYGHDAREAQDESIVVDEPPELSAKYKHQLHEKNGVYKS
jgi:hypothetical protein